MTQEGGGRDGDVSDHLVPGDLLSLLKKVYPVLTGFSRLDLFCSTPAVLCFSLQYPRKLEWVLLPRPLIQSFNTLVKHLHVVAIANVW